MSLPATDAPPSNPVPLPHRERDRVRVSENDHRPHRVSQRTAPTARLPRRPRSRRASMESGPASSCDRRDAHARHGRGVGAIVEGGRRAAAGAPANAQEEQWSFATVPRDAASSADGGIRDLSGEVDIAGDVASIPPRCPGSTETRGWVTPPASARSAPQLFRLQDVPPEPVVFMKATSAIGSSGRHPPRVRQDRLRGRARRRHRRSGQVPRSRPSTTSPATASATT